METKLTLSLDKEVINRAKDYAKIRKTSLSHLVEDYFCLLTAESPVNIQEDNRKSPITDKLLGSVKVEDPDAEKLKSDYLMDKYINA